MIQAFADHPFVAIGLAAYSYGLVSVIGAAISDVISKHQMSKAAGALTLRSIKQAMEKASEPA